MSRTKKYGQNGPRVIVRYKNRKLYDTRESAYITMSDLLQMHEDSYTVLEKETGKDITNEMIVSALAGHYIANPQAFAQVKTDLLAKVSNKTTIVV